MESVSDSSSLADDRLEGTYVGCAEVGYGGRHLDFCGGEAFLT